MRGQQRGNINQQPVTGSMPEGVVDVLELVKVDVKQGAVGTTARHACNGAFQFFLEVVPVEHSGERVVLGMIGKLVLKGLLFGDVTGRAADAGDVAGRILV